MSNHRSRFYAMQQTRTAAKWCKVYLRRMAQALRRGDHVSALSHAEIAWTQAERSAHYAREWQR